MTPRKLRSSVSRGTAKLFTSVKERPYIFMLIFAVVGVALTLGIKAASSFSSTEPELGTVTGPASVINDATASNGKAVKFSASGGSQFPLPPEITSTAQAANVSWKPSATNPDTGIQDYGALHSCPNTDITQSGTAQNPYVIENCDFNGMVKVVGKYVTIRNSRFRGGYPFNLFLPDEAYFGLGSGKQPDNFTGEHLDFDGGGAAEACFVTYALKTTLRNSDLGNCVDLVKYNGGRFEFNYMHDNAVQPPTCQGCDGSHNDGMQIQGGMVDDAIIVGNNIVLPGIVQGPFGGLGPDKSFQMGGETIWDPNPCMYTIIMQNNWIDARNHYWTSFYKQGTNVEQPCYPGAQLRVIGNRFYRQNSSYGFTGFADVKTGNIWHDSGPAKLNGQDLNVNGGDPVIF